MEKLTKARVYKIIPYFVLLLLFIAVIWLMTEVRFFGEVTSRFIGIISPFITGGIIAYILNMPCSSLERLLNKSKRNFIKKRSRPLSVLLLIIIIIFLIQALVQLIVPAIRSSIQFFITMIPVYQQNILNFIDYIKNYSMPQFLEDFIGEDFRPDLILQGIVGQLQFDEIISEAIVRIGGFGAALFRFVLAMITSIYFLLEKDRFKAFVARLVEVLVSEKTNNFILVYSRKLDFNFRQYVFVQTIDGLILGTLMIIALAVLRSPYFLILGLMMGIVNYVPYFGSIFGTVISIIVIAVTQDLRMAVIATIVLFIIQQLDGNVIQPKLMSQSFAISPLLVIVSVTVGGAYGGIMGMLVAIPIVKALQDMIDSFIETNKPRKTEAVMQVEEPEKIEPSPTEPNPGEE